MSGASVAAFCRARDLRVGRFYAWRPRLRDGAADGFVEVAVVGAFARNNPVASHRLFKRSRPRAVRWARTGLPSKFPFAVGAAFWWGLDLTAINFAR